MAEGEMRRAIHEFDCSYKRGQPANSMFNCEAELLDFESFSKLN